MALTETLVQQHRAEMATKQFLDSVVAWEVLGSRWKARNSCDKTAFAQNGTESGVADPLRKHIDMINSHITLDSIGDKAAETWGSAKETPLLAVSGSKILRRPSAALFDISLARTPKSEDNASEGSVSSEAPGVLEHEISDVSVVSDHLPQFSNQACPVESPNSKRKRGSLVSQANTSPCQRHAGRRRRFSTHVEDESVPCTCRRGSSVVSTRRNPDAWDALPPAAFAPPAAPALRRPSWAECRRRSSASSSSSSSCASGACSVAAFGAELKALAAAIPPGDPRIGALYAAATRAFGPPAFTPDPRANPPRRRRASVVQPEQD